MLINFYLYLPSQYHLVQFTLLFLLLFRLPILLPWLSKSVLLPSCSVLFLSTFTCIFRVSIIWFSLLFFISLCNAAFFHGSVSRSCSLVVDFNASPTPAVSLFRTASLRSLCNDLVVSFYLFGSRHSTAILTVLSVVSFLIFSHLFHPFQPSKPPQFHPSHPILSSQGIS